VTLALGAGTAVPAQESPPADVASRAQEAIEHLAAGRAESAVELLEPLRDTADATPRLLALLGTAYLEAGRAEDALSVLAPLADAADADPAVLYNAGRAAFAAGDAERAEGYLERSVELQPGTPASRELGLQRGREGRMREAYRLLRPWVTANPGDTEARLAAAMAAIQIERVPDAERFLEGLSTDSPRVRLLSAQLRLMQGDPRGALAILAPVLSDPPSEMEMDIRRAAAEAHLAVGQAEQAIELLEGRAEADPATALKLAQAQDQIGELESALATMKPFADRLLVIARETEGRMQGRDLAATFASEYGRLLVTAGRHEEALPHLELATRLAPDERQAWQSLGQSLAAVGRRDEATAALERFQELAESAGPATAGARRRARDTQDPTGREVRRAQELLTEDQGEQALTVIREEKKLTPDDIRTWLMEARILLFEERVGEALEVAEETVRRFPEYVDAYYQRGTVHLALEHFEEAEEDLRRALDLDPDHVPSMNDLAVLLIVRDREAEARRLLERVLELRPEDPRAQETLQNLQAADSG
jgi:Flp pilus assembly protein TadD